jgi:YesN/AraC family two-component response regulator
MQKLQKLKPFMEKLHILYVEDNDEAREQTIKLLHNFFIYIDTAVDGKDGLGKFNSFYEKNNAYYDLVITDINMPNMNGLKLLEEIKKEHYDTPVLIISAHNDAQYLLESIRLGVDGFILKPIKMEQLVANILKTTKLIYVQHENKTQQQLLLQQTKHSALEELVFNISHQWKQPLSAISILIQDIEDAYEYNEIDQEYIDTFKTSALKNIDYLTSTINQLSKYSIHNINHLPKETFGVKELIQNALSICNETIQVTFATDDDFELSGIKQDFQALIACLLENSEDAFLSNDIKSPSITISIDAQTKQIDILDNGLGVKEENIEKIFEPYYSTKFHDRGVGMSLYVARLIMEKQYKGFIQAKNVNDGLEMKLSFK